MNYPEELNAWKRLKTHFSEIGDIDMRDMFETDCERVEKFSIRDLGIYFDYSKNLISTHTMDILVDLAKEAEVENARDKMFAGNKINFTENRAVLHTALRGGDNDLVVDGQNVRELINHEFEKVKGAVEAIRNGDWVGFGGKRIKNIVNIGIGGSDLGPKMVSEALIGFSKRDINVFFLSNVDYSNLYEVLRDLDMEETLFVVCSKSFKTEETLLNARSARDWFLGNGGAEEDIAKHFVAVSTNKDKVQDFGIDANNNMFGFWDFIGGRYSVWSAVGFSLACSIGWDNFEEFLKGGRDMDLHFQSKSITENMPIVLALIGIWYNNFWESDTYAVLPYSYYMRGFPRYLQQLDMESNGKGVNKEGKRVSVSTGPIVWGSSGTNGQHAFYQLIHQGTKMIPCDFIGFKKSFIKEGQEHHDMLIANMFAQAEALMIGRSLEEIQGESLDMPEHRVMIGNKPSNTIFLDELSPRSIGRLVALYEHKVFVQGIVWGINSFDQWGVELGKKLAGNIQKDFLGKGEVNHDSSTAKLVDYYSG